jgi:hypothetical protein
MIAHLSSGSPLTQEHGTIEQYIRDEGHELLRRLFQAHLEVRASQENKQDTIVNLESKHLTHCRNNTKATLTSLFGDVNVNRKGYSKRKITCKYPLDGELNLTKDQFSDGLRLLVAEQVSHCAYDNVVKHINQNTGGNIAKRQCLDLVQDMAQDMAQDFESYYLKNRYCKPEDIKDLLVLTFDRKGIVMRPNSLRECTKKKAKKSQKLNSQLSAGEKKDRKRLAQVASVYTVLPHHRSAESIMKCDESNVCTVRAPARNKRVWASVELGASLKKMIKQSKNGSANMQ